MNSTESSPPSDQQPPPPVHLRRIAEIAIVLIVIGLLIGLVPRWLAHRKLLAETRTNSNIIVTVVSPTAAKSDLSAPLSADVQAYIQASIHARASGYLKNWYVDIGDHVTNGQVIALIDTPELDEQITQAKAQVDQAIAQLNLSKITADRWSNLVKTASVSDQENAEKQSDYILKQADVEAARANLQRLQDLKDFDSVTAPFNGVITARNTDIGQLISAGSGAELYRMAQTDPLRVYVQVPQQYVFDIKPGQKADLSFIERPDKVFQATVTRTAGAVDPTTRTLQVELQVPNPNGELFAGSYSQVRFNHTPSHGAMTISDNAIIFQAAGTQVAVVDNDNKVHLRDIKVGRDFGDTIEVLSGLNTNDQVINNPPDSLADGMTVEVAKPQDTNAVSSAK
jgi:membrane fusion protein (multidrug efflux system)